jgi:hypothetical protein
MATELHSKGYTFRVEKLFSSQSTEFVNMMRNITLTSFGFKNVVLNLRV